MGLKRIRRDLAFPGEIVDLYRDTVELPDGKREEWDYVHHKKGGGSCVVPVLQDGRILLVRQYRPALDLTMLEVPAGCRDSDEEDPAETAKRELLEETGYQAQSLTFLARIHTAGAWTNEQTQIFLAEKIRRVSGQHLDEAEDIRLEAYDLEFLLGEIRAGRITDAKTVAGIFAFAALKNRS